MKNKAGCPLKDCCDLYNEEYRGTMVIMHDNFKRYCEEGAGDAFSEICPVYDAYMAGKLSTLAELTLEVGEKINESAGRIEQRLDECVSALQEPLKVITKR
jgi:hypothetical protein